jgi:apolipoprotein N-acyltransferase
MRTLLAAALTAALTALCFPPFDLGFVAFGALVPLLLVTGESGGRRDLFVGWLTGWAASTALVWWVINTITRYGGVPWSLAVPILLLMTCTLGLFWAIFCWARGRILRRLPRWTDFLISPLLWVALEYGWARTPDISFPWSLMGYTQYLNLRILQAADLFGVWGISFLVVSANAAVASLLRSGPPEGRRDGWAARLLPAAGAAAMFLGAWVYGEGRLQEVEKGAPFEVVVLQGNVEQEIKWDPKFRREAIDLYGSLTREAAGEGAGLVVWPETAAPFYYGLEPRYSREIQELAREVQAPILFGSPAREEGAGGVSLRNRAYLVSAAGEDVGWYDKVHLVPFGEYVPWRRLLFFVDKIVEAVGEFSPGEGPVTLAVPGARVGTLICYEVVFPDLVRRAVNDGAQILVNITNDAWFGRTAASKQHFSALAFRAVENRRPVARAANTGISGFVDSRGRILQASELFVRGHYRAVLHPSSERTLYGRVGDVFPAACAVAVLAILLGTLRQKRRKKRYHL